MLQIAIDDKLNRFLAKGSVYESLPGSAFSGRNHSLGCALVLYGISDRELQEMLAECGVNVDHTTIYRWVQRYAPEIEKRLRWYWRHPTDLSS